ncbi:MAG: hypothetical protein AAFS10_24230, partial [Myxococcota bacterium]
MQHHRTTTRTTAWLLGTALLILAVASVANAQDPGTLTAQQIMAKMQEFYRNTYDYQARFEQIYTDMAAGEDKKSQRILPGFFKKTRPWDF